MKEQGICLSETVRTMADAVLVGKGKVLVLFEPAFLYEVANVLAHYEDRQWELDNGKQA